MSAYFAFGNGASKKAEAWKYLNAVVSVRKVIHGFELLVNNTNAGFMCATGNPFDILGRFAHLLELMMDVLGSLNGGLRVELG